MYVSAGTTFNLNCKQSDIKGDNQNYPQIMRCQNIIYVDAEATDERNCWFKIVDGLGIIADSLKPTGRYNGMSDSSDSPLIITALSVSGKYTIS